MSDGQRIAFVFRLGRSILWAHSVAVSAVLIPVVFLAIYQTVTGRARVQVPVCADGVVVWALFVPFFTVLVLDGLLILFIERLAFRVHHAGLGRRCLIEFSILVPFWGVRLYDRFRARTLELFSAGPSAVRARQTEARSPDQRSDE